MDKEEILEEIRRNDMQLESLRTRLSGSNVYHYEQNLDARLKEIEDELKDDTQTEDAQNKRYKLRVEKDRISDLKRLRELQAKQAELRKQLRGEKVTEKQDIDKKSENVQEEKTPLVDTEAPTEPIYSNQEKQQTAEPEQKQPEQKESDENIKSKYMEMWQNYNDVIIALETWKQKEQNLDRWMSNHYKRWEAGEIDVEAGDWIFDDKLNEEYEALAKEVDDAYAYFQKKDAGTTTKIERIYRCFITLLRNQEKAF